MDNSEIGDGPFSVLIEYQVRTENNTVDDWLDVWNERAEHARLAGPETMAYGSAVNLEDPTNVLVFERYQHGQSSLQAHMDQPAHSALLETMGARQMTKRRVMTTMFTDVADLGWWARPGSVDASNQSTILVALGLRFGSAAAQSTFLELSQAHAEYCWDAEPETVIYSAGIATADADREIDLHQGELVFVMGCTDLEAIDKHANDPKHVALGARCEELGLQMQRTFMRIYKTTGHGFLWR